MDVAQTKTHLVQLTIKVNYLRICLCFSNSEFSIKKFPIVTFMILWHSTFNAEWYTELGQNLQNTLIPKRELFFPPIPFFFPLFITFDPLSILHTETL